MPFEMSFLMPGKHVLAVKVELMLFDLNAALLDFRFGAVRYGSARIGLSLGFSP